MSEGNNVVRDKSFRFALRIVKLCQYLTEQKREYVLSKQVLRSGTAIGALIRESQYAESKADFIHKLAIALKEANETDYWIELLYQSEYIEEKSYKSIHHDIDELISILVAIVKKSKQNK
jgi:four helix bundle protein